ncbi:AAA domain protein [uncultured archaeon]|nr:AAA domain protein [uncultured archaeon]
MENHKDKLTIVIEEYWRKVLPDAKYREIPLKIESDHINDIIGARRAGKTYLMFYIIKKLLDEGVQKDATIYINFENRKILPLTSEYFNDLIEVVYAKSLLEKHNKVFIFLDEVQRIEGWEKYIRSIYDEFKGRIKIFVSGSNSKLTESEFSSLLTGRHLTTQVYPLSFSEFLSFKGFNHKKEFLIEKDLAAISEYFREYMEYGGFPEVALLRSGKEDLIQTLFSDIINRDIMPKTKRRGDIVEDMAYFLCSNSGKLTSFSKLTGMLNSMGIKVSVPTFEKYFSAMKDAFLFLDITIFSYKVKDQLQYPRKIYCVDTGFINFAGFKFSEDKGRLMENLVAVELQRRKSRSPINEVFYWKDIQEKEVDFVIREGLEVRQLIQVTYASLRGEIEKREINGLIKAEEEFNCGNLLVITWEYEGEEEIKGKKIAFMPLWKWLLADGRGWDIGSEINIGNRRNGF